MSSNASILPGQAVPELRLATVGGGAFDIGACDPEAFTVIVAYRGLHCPICRKHLGELARRMDELRKRGVRAVAVSMDNGERARQSKEDWGLEDLEIGFGMTEETARAWGLYISESIKDEEPRRFSEPGLFLVRPDRSLYAASIQTMPFARPRWDDVLDAIDFVGERGYPPRGTVGRELTRSAA